MEKPSEISGKIGLCCRNVHVNQHNLLEFLLSGKGKMWQEEMITLLGMRSYVRIEQDKTCHIFVGL